VATIGFGQDESVLTSAMAAQLGLVVLMLEDLPPTDRIKARLQITGHACDIGSDDRNDELSRSRAEAVARALEQMGVPRAMMQLSSVGKRKLLVRANTDEARKQNRRAEVVLLLE
jgi:outer membrane protein OmpA-like peptidoglycan-associated protein